MISVVRAFGLATLLPLAWIAPADAWDMSGQKKIILHTNDGKDIPIGTVDFTPTGDGASFKLDVDQRNFKEFFLSMRQFKCLDGPDIQCIVPYPYRNPDRVTAQDLSWLEHALLFFYKKPNDYGAKMQNGLYYKMRITDEGIVGLPMAIDLDRIASPPADLSTPPYKLDDRDDITAGSRWIESLRIE